MSTAVPLGAPEPYILAAFGVADADSAPLSALASNIWRAGDVVFRHVTHPAEAAWIAQLFDNLRLTGIRIPRPLRALDGRWVVGGWRAERFVAGRPAADYAALARAAQLFHAALVDCEKPRFLTDGQRPLLCRLDDQVWWEPESVVGTLGDSAAGTKFVELLHMLPAVGVPFQLIHGNIFGKVLFAGTAPPAVIDFAPLWRPAAYGVALPIVDAIAWDNGPVSLAAAWSHLPEWGNMLGRALLARVAVASLHPRSTAVVAQRVLDAADRLVPTIAELLI